MSNRSISLSKENLDIELRKMSAREQFPDFDYALPTLPGFVDESWHNDVCPNLARGELRLWCDYADTAKREFEGGKRFHLVHYDASGDAMSLMQTDDISEIVAALAETE